MLEIVKMKSNRINKSSKAYKKAFEERLERQVESFIRWQHHMNNLTPEEKILQDQYNEAYKRALNS
jgi:hypothetical protein